MKRQNQKMNKHDAALASSAATAASTAKAGLAIDEAILVSAMIGSVGLFAAVSIPWDQINLGGFNAVVSELEAIEAANADFYSQYRRWPHQLTNGSWANNAAVLVTKNALTGPYQDNANFAPLLRDVPFEATAEGMTLRHGYGQGGRILQGPSDKEGYAMKVVFENVPMSRIRGIDEAVDGAVDPGAGRLQVEARIGGVTDMVYYANKL